MRLGVIDVGSNTVHLLIVDARPGAHPIPASSFKHELRLAEHLTEDGDIDEDGAETLARFAVDCLDHAAELGAAKVLGFATSAIRDARNTEEVLACVREVSGVDLQVLSGEEEARLTFLAARRWCGWSSGHLMMVDIGGGSLELAVGRDEDPSVAVSLPLGAGRLTRHVPGEVVDAEDVKRLRRHIRTSIGEVVPDLTVRTPHKVVGTSKTMRSLARLQGAAPSGEGPFVRRVLERDALKDWVERLTAMPVSQRANLPGVNQNRAPQILAGALVAEGAMDLLGIESLEICPWALREGVLLQFLDHLDTTGLLELS
ncbi:Ppx/GppA family phosphatase [Kytococcus sp. Marseille-QA3725]